MGSSQERPANINIIQIANNPSSDAHTPSQNSVDEGMTEFDQHPRYERKRRDSLMSDPGDSPKWTPYSKIPPATTSELNLILTHTPKISEIKHHSLMQIYANNDGYHYK